MSDSAAIEEADPDACIQLYRNGFKIPTLRRRLETASEDWVKTFLEGGGLEAILASLKRFGGTVEEGGDAEDGVEDSWLQCQCVEGIKGLMGKEAGMKYMVSGDRWQHMETLVLYLDSENRILKKIILEVLSIMAYHSERCHSAFLDALLLYKKVKQTRHQFAVLVDELQSGDSTSDYQATVMTAIKCIVGTPQDVRMRVKLRNQFLVLGLQSIITHLHSTTSDRELIALLGNWEQQQIYDQNLMESVEGFNPEDPHDVFDHLMAKVNSSSEAAKLTSIMTNLLTLHGCGQGRSTGDAIWGAIEGAVASVADSEIAKAPPQQKHQQGFVGMLQPPQSDTFADITIHNECAVDEIVMHDECSADAADTPANAPCAPPLGGPPPPPPPGAPPPPPPPLLPGPRTGVPRQRLYWKKLHPHELKKSATVWSTKERKGSFVAIKEKEVVSIFTPAPASGKPSGTTNPPDQSAKKVKSFIEHELAQPVEILLHKLKSTSPTEKVVLKTGSMTNAEIKRERNRLFIEKMAAMVKGESAGDEDDIDLSYEQAKELWKLSKQVAASTAPAELKTYTGNVGDLAMPDQFFREMFAIPNYDLHLQFMYHEREFQEKTAVFEEQIQHARGSVETIRKSKHLPELLHVVLEVGNIMNAGYKDGGADGFGISSLERVCATKSAKESLIHFITRKSLEQGRTAPCLGFLKEFKSLKDSRVDLKVTLELLKGKEKSKDTEREEKDSAQEDENKTEQTLKRLTDCAEEMVASAPESFKTKAAKLREQILLEVDRLGGVHAEERGKALEGLDGKALKPTTEAADVKGKSEKKKTKQSDFSLKEIVDDAEQMLRSDADGLRKQVSEFVEEARQDLDRMQEMADEVEAECLEMVDFFGEDSSTFTVRELFLTLKKFADDMEKAIEENQSEMERASKKRKQKRESNMKMFDQYIKELRGTDHRFSEQQTRNSAASFQRVASKSFNQAATLATSNAALRRQQTHVTEEVLTRRWCWSPSSSTRQADSSDHKATLSPLTNPLHGKFEFGSHSAEVPQIVFQHSTESPSVEAPKTSAPTCVEAPKTATLLPAVAEDSEVAEVDTNGSQNSQVIAPAEQLNNGYHRTPDGLLEAEV